MIYGGWLHGGFPAVETVGEEDGVVLVCVANPFTKLLCVWWTRRLFLLVIVGFDRLVCLRLASCLWRHPLHSFFIFNCCLVS